MKGTWNRALATLLTIAMMATLLVVPAAAGDTYTYNLDTGAQSNSGFFSIEGTASYKNFGTALTVDSTTYNKGLLLGKTSTAASTVTFTGAGTLNVLVAKNQTAGAVLSGKRVCVDENANVKTTDENGCATFEVDTGNHVLYALDSMVLVYAEFTPAGGEDPEESQSPASSEPPASTPSIELDQDSVTLSAGSTVKLTATVANWEDEVSWTSSDPDVATVEPDADDSTKATVTLVEGVTEGEATITATLGEGEDAPTASCKVTVMEDLDGILHVFSDNATVEEWKADAVDGVKVYTGTTANTYVGKLSSTNTGATQTTTFKGVAVTQGIKLDSKGYILFTAPKAGTVTLYFAKDKAGTALSTSNTVGCVEGDESTAIATGEAIGDDYAWSFTAKAGVQYKIARKSGESVVVALVWTASDWATKHTTHDFTIKATEGDTKYNYCSTPVCMEKEEAGEEPPEPASRTVNFAASNATVSEVKQGETELVKSDDGKYTANTTDDITFEVTAADGYELGTEAVKATVSGEEESTTTTLAAENGVYTIDAGEGNVAVSVTATQQKSATPAFQESQVQLLKDKKVTLTLTTAPAADTVFRIYAAADDTTPAGTAGATGVTADANKKITFTLQDMPAADTTYYVRATESGKAASDGAPIALKTYVPATSVKFNHVSADGEITHVIYLGGTGTGNAENHNTSNEPEFPSAWKLSATVEPEGATDKSYTISNAKATDDCIHVDNDGTVEARKVGTGQVELKQADLSAVKATIIVKPKLDSITVKNGDATVGTNDVVVLAMGETAILSAEVVFSSAVTDAMTGDEEALGAYKTVKWTVTEGDDVIGLSGGTITTKKAGDAKITVSDGDGQVSKVIDVRVAKGTPALTITPATANVVSGDTVTLKVNGAKGTLPTLTFDQGGTDATANFTVPTGVDDGNGNFTFTGITVPANSTGTVVSYTVTATVAESADWDSATATGIITVQPAGAKVITVTAPAGSHDTATAIVGQSEAVTLSVTASLTNGEGGETLAYAWSKGEDDIPGATGASYTVPAADLATAGVVSYTCVVSVEGDSAIDPVRVTFEVTVSNPALIGITVSGEGYTDGQVLALVGPGAVVLDVAKDPANADGDIILTDSGEGGVVTGALANGKLTITPTAVTTGAVDIVLSCGDKTKTIQVTVARAAKPDPDVTAADVTVTAPTAADGQGTITVDASKFPGATFMYKAAAATTWTEMSGNTASVAPGSYLVRVKVDKPALQEVGEGAEVTVPEYSAPVTVTGVDISGGSSVAVEGTLQLEAVVHMSDNTTTDAASWSTSDATKATVNATTGLVTGVAEGQVTITATSTADPTKTASKTITVTAKSAQTACDKTAVDAAISAARAEMKKYGAGAAADVFQGKKVVSEADMKALTDKIAEAVAASNASKDKTIVPGDALDTANKAAVAALNAAVEAIQTAAAGSTETGTKTDAGAKVLTGDAVFAAAAADTANWTKNGDKRYDTKAAYTMRVADYFDVKYKSGGRVDASGAGVFADGYAGEHRINLNEGMGTNTGFVSFTVAEGKSADVKLWWVCNNTDSTMTLKSATATVPTPEGTVQLGTANVAAIATWKNVPAGTYQLGGVSKSNYIFRVEVVEKDEGQPLPTKYTVTVTGGTADKAEAAEGESVTVTANTPETGKVFDKWTTDDLTLSATDEVKGTLTFTMPAKNVALTATYKNDQGGEGPGGETVDKTALEAAIADAEKLAGVVGSADGTDVATNKEWVATAKREALDTALREAKALGADATQEQVTAAAEKLAAAVKDVTDNKAAGTKVSRPHTSGGSSTSTTTPSTSTTTPDGTKVAVSTGKDGATTAVVTVPGNVDKTTVTIPVTEPDSGLVPVIVNADGTEEIVRMSAVTDEGVVLTLDKSATVKLVNNAKEFVDVPGHWAEKSVDFATARELFNGTDATHFTPNGAMTRGMMATVLFRLDGENEGKAANHFTDVADTWYTDAVAWAAEQGVVNGYGNGTFLPEKSINREELAVMVYRYAKALGLGYAAGQEIPDLAYADAEGVSEWAYEAISWLTLNGVLNGKPGNVIDADGLATRAEVSAVLERFVKLAK